MLRVWNVYLHLPKFGTCEPDQQRSTYFWWDWWVNPAFLCPMIYFVYIICIYIYWHTCIMCTLSCFGDLPPVMIFDTTSHPYRKKIWQAFDLAHFLEALCHYRCSELAAAQDLVPRVGHGHWLVSNHWSQDNTHKTKTTWSPKNWCFGVDVSSFFKGVPSRKLPSQ